MAGVMIGTGPHKASHTAVAVSGAEERLGELRVRASAVQAGRLLEWAVAWPERTWAAGGGRRAGAPAGLAAAGGGRAGAGASSRSWPRGSGCWPPGT
jgi:hypothetical protein